MNPKELSDSEIIDLIVKTGNTDYFGELYDRYSAKVFRKCCSMVGNEADAEDLSQNVLMKAFTNISRFEGRSKFATWIYAITYNTCINFLKTKQKKAFLTDEFDDQIEGIGFGNDDIESKKIFEVELEQLKQILDEIKAEDRRMLLMKYQDNLSIDNIAKELDLTSSAVKMRLLRARGRVRKIRDKLK